MAFACKSGDTIKTMQLDEAISLKINAGEADVVLTVKAGENSQDLTVKVGAGADNKAALAPYVIRILKLDPYPVPNQSIQSSDRVIELRVDRTDD